MTPASAGRKILVVTGLEREGKIVAGPATQVILSGASRAALERRLEAAGSGPWAAVVSFGLAGALASGLAPGDIVLGTSVVSMHGRFATSDTLCSTWQVALVHAGFRPTLAAIAGVDAPVMSPADKAALRVRTAADAVDMESHVAAEFAQRHALVFGVIRVISDGSERTLPPVAGAAMRPDGGIDLSAVILGLLRSPGQLPALIATGRDAQVAFRCLSWVSKALGPGLNVADEA